MKYKKIMFMLVLAIFIFGAASICASDVNDTVIASEDTSQLELSAGSELDADNLKTSEKNTILTQTNNDESMSGEIDSEVLGADIGTYSGLSEEIGSGGNIELIHDYYTYDSGSTIEISDDNSVIDGKGAVIDMAGSNKQAFDVSASGVIIKNLTIKNAKYNALGGAILFGRSGTVENCIFTNNSGTSSGGAVYFSNTGTVTNCTFVGNTASVDGGAVYFSNTGIVTNCNFINNKATGTAGEMGSSGDGGAVHFTGDGTVTNCNFTGNTATGDDGGAVHFTGDGTVSNCTFVGNTAGRSGGGAVYFSDTGIVTNCNFTNNKATGGSIYGGAIWIYSGTVTNCSFTNHSANYGGAVRMGSGSVENCNFTDNTATRDGGAIWIYSGNVTNCNFTNSSATGAGGAVYFYDNSEVTNCNFIYNVAKSSTLGGGAIFFMISGNVAKCNFTDNSASFGGAVLFGGKGNISNSNFTNNSASNGGGAINMASGSVENCNFTDNKATSSSGGSIWFTGNGDVINCIFTNNSATGDGGAVYFYEGATGRIINCNFTNNKVTGTNSWGGAIRMSSGTVSNCNFTNNTAIGDGGAVFFDTGNVTNCNFADNTAAFGGAVFFDTGNVTNCNFADNTASLGGAVFFFSTGNVTNCNFTGNNATTGSAIYFYSTSATKTVSNSRFLNNRANAEALEITKNDNNITITFTGGNNLLNAIYSSNDAEVTFTNVTYWGANGITTVSATMSGSNKEEGQNITVGVVVNNELVLSDVMVTDENGMIVLDISAGENYYISARHNTDSYYTEAEKTISNNTKFNVNVTSQTTTNKTVNITAKSNIPNDVVQGKLLFIVPNNDPINATYSGNGTWWAVYTFDDYAVYEVNASYIGLDNVTITNGTINIGKIPTSISVENETADLFVGDSINTGAALTPADAGNLTYTSSDESVAKVENGKIIAMGDGTAVITVSFTGREGYAPCENKTIKVTAVRVPTHLTVENITAHPGDKVNIKVNVTADDAIPFNGNINFILPDNSTVPVKIADGSGIVNWIIPEGYEGKYPTNATFEGDRRYLPSNAFGSITINKYDSKVTISPIASIDYGNNVTIKYSIENRTNINVTIDGVSYDKIINGDTITVIFPDAGNYNITIINNENYLYKSSNDTKSFTVNKVKSSLDVNGTSIYFGEDALLNYTTVNATGIEVTITDWRENPLTEGVDYNITVTGTQIILNFFDDGIHYVNVTTLTDANHIPTTEKVTVSVNPISDLEIILNPMNQTVNYGDVINWTAKIVNNGPNYALKSYFDVYASQGLVFTNPNVHAYSNHYRVDVPFQLSQGSYFTILINAMVNTTNADLTLNVSVSDEYTPDPNPTNNNASATVKAEYATADVTLTAPSEITAGDNLTVNVELPSDATGNVTASINGKNYTQEVKDGKATITVPDMDAGKNNINISYSGDDKYSPCEKSVEVTVKKATPKMTVKAKTFKDTTKTKKYTITLKDNKGNAIKNAKVYLKVNGITYTATTNSKGQATFKIIKLTKKGTYIATITYNGNKNYNKITKKAKITVKETWKTISKGSKNTAMVKKIQKALKKNGFYIKEKGRYLKIDGIYQKYTVKAVKQFQKAKGLKVTGKVDYTTAKKLKLI